MLPPLAALIPRIIRVLELLFELYGILAPCLGCALRGCFGGCFGCGKRKKKTSDDGCDCPCPPPEEEKKSRTCLSSRRKEEKQHRDGCARKKLGEEKKRHWWERKQTKGRTLQKSPPSPVLGDEDAELHVLQRQYSSLPQPPEDVHHVEHRQSREVLAAV